MVSMSVALWLENSIMLRATAIVRKPAVRAERVVDTVTLDHEGRHRRRVALIADGGLELLLDLDKATALNEGDALRLDDGRLVQVRAAPQKLVEITAENPKRLLKIAWHIGNRHTPAEIAGEAVYIEDDHVLVEMARCLGGAIRAVERPFQPERGAYDQGGREHDHSAHGHAGHDHSGHAHAAPAHGEPGHVHGPDCGHDHSDHGHDHGHAHHDHGHKHG
jgi:urease accessory protein